VVIYFQAFLGDPMSKEIHFHHLEFTLLKLNLQLVFPQPLEHFSKMLHMFFHIVVIDQNVVYVYDHKIIKPLLENVVHECAKCGKCIGESKGITKNLYEPYLVW
jgi:hypothetical protein